ncbi:MAG: hypothetical protein AAF844_00770 [Pseudomonadota bacterium]
MKERILHELDRQQVGVRELLRIGSEEAPLQFEETDVEVLSDLDAAADPVDLGLLDEDALEDRVVVVDRVEGCEGTLVEDGAFEGEGRIDRSLSVGCDLRLRRPPKVLMLIESGLPPAAKSTYPSEASPMPRKRAERSPSSIMGALSTTVPRPSGKDPISPST